jgi:hypothetical protein
MLDRLSGRVCVANDTFYYVRNVGEVTTAESFCALAEGPTTSSPRNTRIRKKAPRILGRGYRGEWVTCSDGSIIGMT